MGHVGPSAAGNGALTVGPSGERRVDALQRNAEIYAQVRLLVLMGLAAAGVGRNRIRTEAGVRRSGHKRLGARRAGDRQAPVRHGRTTALGRVALHKGVDRSSRTAGHGQFRLWDQRYNQKLYLRNGIRLYCGERKRQTD